MAKQISVVIVAAGSSNRMGLRTNKIFLDLCGQSVIERTINAFVDIPEIYEIVLVTKKEFFNYFNNIIKSVSLNIKLVEGGSSREESTFNGLQEVSNDSNFVICHDGARPLISKKTILNVINELSNYKAVITGVKAKDTVKIISSDLEVVSTPDRRSLYNIQTPQAFEKNIILEGYKKFFEENGFVTDDASIVEKLNVRIKLVEGEYSNIKITTIEDINYARILLERGI
ncbi:MULTISPECIES: 2-C-methyl-D-erythritol 4-phosphate cytidylyltransferase [unclassified Parvimonas]|uniref:2-C-methyl-D-erythritol 4-phosphate cytidylyltransferase n=1 Tax=unclassified Parvimonas TaxID=1151464 RepID=UPI00021D3906|nr:2-C-methyl-D-erythritol 4-phosphate cytidylyltransferase [Parvimonas sp. oral taxon 393 str. F0440]